jgi:serine/threonine protein kinase
LLAAHIMSRTSGLERRFTGAFRGAPRMEGQTISHYRVLSEIGRGGMGIVYKAEDIRLHRPVALKFLSQELTRDFDAKQRFIQEARAASSLDHPNICTIYDVDESADGQLFLAMAYYEGEPLNRRLLRGALDPAVAIDIAKQVASGLAKAHDAGIIHRDVKPANLFVTREGLVKILDFGVAKLVGRAGLTRTDAVLGTLAYMAPEQRHGREADARTDLWSLGVVLYEMLTGQLPFADVVEPGSPSSGKSETEKALRLVNRAASSGLERVVLRAIQQDPRNRYASAQELIRDLEASNGALKQSARPQRLSRRVAIQAGLATLVVPAAGLSLYLWNRNKARLAPKDASAPQAQPPSVMSQPRAPASSDSLAVLPFRNNSSNREQEYFADGITDELINQLAKLKALRVIAHTSAFAFKGSEENIQSIAEKLGVRHVLEGSVSRAGDAVRITAQLIDAQDGFTLWSDSYNRELDDIFRIQDDIARSVAAALRATLGLKEEEKKEGSVMLGGTADIRAYDLYLSARALLNDVKRGVSDPRDRVEKCLEQIQLAIKLDDKFALAWVLKSNAHDTAQIYYPERVDDHRTLGEDAAKRAYALEPNLPQAHLELAFKAVGQLEWTAAEEEFTEARALGLSADEMSQYAFLLANTGHIRRARDLFLVSRASDPLNSNLFMYLLVTYDILGDKAALEFYDRGKVLFPNWPAGAGARPRVQSRNPPLRRP